MVWTLAEGTFTGGIGEGALPVSQPGRLASPQTAPASWLAQCWKASRIVADQVGFVRRGKGLRFGMEYRVLRT